MGRKGEEKGEEVWADLRGEGRVCAGIAGIVMLLYVTGALAAGLRMGVERHLGEKFGTEVHVHGCRIAHTGMVEVTGVVVRRPEEMMFDVEEILRIGSLKVEIDPYSLFSDTVRIRRLIISDVEINAELKYGILNLIATFRKSQRAHAIDAQIFASETLRKTKKHDKHPITPKDQSRRDQEEAERALSSPWSGLFKMPDDIIYDFMDYIGLQQFSFDLPDDWEWFNDDLLSLIDDTTSDGDQGGTFMTYLKDVLITIGDRCDEFLEEWNDKLEEVISTWKPKEAIEETEKQTRFEAVAARVREQRQKVAKEVRGFRARAVRNFKARFGIPDTMISGGETSLQGKRRYVVEEMDLHNVDLHLYGFKTTPRRHTVQGISLKEGTMNLEELRMDSRLLGLTPKGHDARTLTKVIVLKLLRYMISEKRNRSVWFSTAISAGRDATLAAIMKS